MPGHDASSDTAVYITYDSNARDDEKSIGAPCGHPSREGLFSPDSHTHEPQVVVSVNSDHEHQYYFDPNLDDDQESELGA